MAHLRLDAHLDPVGSLLSLEDQPERFMGDSSFGRGLSGEVPIRRSTSSTRRKMR